MGHFTDAIRLPSASFPTIGDTISGEVLEIAESTVPTFDGKGRIVPDTPRTDDAGNVMKQIDVTLDTGNGKKAVLHTGGSIYYAIGRALAEIGADDLATGDTLTVTYTGDGEPTAKGRNAPKQYSATVAKG